MLTSSRDMKLRVAVLRQKAPEMKPGRAYGYSSKKATCLKSEYCDAGLARMPPVVLIDQPSVPKSVVCL
jgi:hypothetical protein